MAARVTGAWPSFSSAEPIALSNQQGHRLAWDQDFAGGHDRRSGGQLAHGRGLVPVMAGLIQAIGPDAMAVW